MSAPATCLEARRIAKSLGFAITLHREGGEPVDVGHADDADVRARLTDKASGAVRNFGDWRAAWRAAVEQSAGEAGDVPERYIVRFGSRLYRVAPDAASRASHAKAEVLAALGDTDAWPGELGVWTEADYIERYGEPRDVVDVAAARRCEPCRMCGTTGACRECDGDGKCASCSGPGLGDYAIDAEDECPDCDRSGVCAWCGGAGGCPACSGTGTLDIADDADRDRRDHAAGEVGERTGDAQGEGLKVRRAG